MESLRAVWQRTRQAQISILVVAVFVTGFFMGTQRSTSEAQNSPLSPADEKAFESLWEVYHLIQYEYIDTVDREVLVNGAINGMVEALGDQFSGYMDPHVFPLLDSDLSGEIEGIGVVIRTIEETGEIEIVNVMEGTPAKKAGLMRGDIFMAVNGEDVIGLNQLELAGKVRGPAGTDVTITVRRSGENVEFTITRARIVIPNIEAKILEDAIGYIKLYQFSSDARAQIDNALKELDVNALRGLIFDLRGNPGGLLSSAVQVASTFVKEGPIVYEDFGDGREQTFNADGTYANIQVPIVVLVDETSASASELVAGALKDLKLATIIGETTLGKGTVQQWHSLSNGGGIRLTIARWLTPNRHWIHDQGITPDVIIHWTPENHDENTDPQLQGALGYLKAVSTISAK